MLLPSGVLAVCLGLIGLFPEGSRHALNDERCEPDPVGQNDFGQSILSKITRLTS